MLRYSLSFLFFFNDTATTEIYTLSLHDALPISLVDAQTFVGRYALDSLQVAGHWIRLALYPQADYTPAVAKSLRDVMQRAAASQDELMGGAPYDTYTIFFSIIHEPVGFGGGLEHP